MKNFNVVYSLLSLLLILAFGPVVAQDYVLTTRGDSLSGEVKPLFFGSQQKVQIRDAEKNKTTFSLPQIRAVSFEGDIYHPVRGENGYVFMKLIQAGYLSLYAYQLPNQSRFDALLLSKRDGSYLVVPNLGFKKYVSQYLEDCPAVGERIKEGELGRKDLSEIITAYNTCIGNRTIDHKAVMVKREEKVSKLGAWESLEEKVKAADFAEKTDALEMIAEIRKKIEGEEKIPNFLLEGLKNSLANAGLSAELEAAIQEISGQ